MDTGAYSVTKQNGMLKTIKFLSESKKYYDIYENVNKNYESSKEQLFEAKGKIKVLSVKLKEYNTVLDGMNAEFKSKQEMGGKFKEELDGLEEKVQAVKTEIGELFEQKNQIREEHYKAKFQYEHQFEEIEYYKYLTHQKDRLVKEEKERLKKIEDEKRREKERLERQQNMPNPYEDDILQTQYLITQLKLKKRDFETNIGKYEADQKRREEDLSRKKEIEKRQEEGKIEVHIKTKEPRIVIGECNKKKRRQNKKQAKPSDQPVEEQKQEEGQTSKKLEFKYDIVKGLIELNLNVPDKIEDISKTIDELDKLREALEEKGKKELEKLFENSNWEEIDESKIRKGSGDIVLEYEEEEEDPRKKRFNQDGQPQNKKKHPRQKLNAEDEKEFMPLGS
jgi:hypothetical protein